MRAAARILLTMLGLLTLLATSVWAQSVTWYATITTDPQGNTQIRLYETRQLCLTTWRDYEPQLRASGARVVAWICKPLSSDEAVLYEGPPVDPRGVKGK